MQRTIARDHVSASFPMLPEPSESYYRDRYYDLAQGRFLSEDPSGFRAEINFYRYVFDKPVDFGDPLGGWASLKRAEIIFDSAFSGGVAGGEEISSELCAVGFDFFFGQGAAPPCHPR